MTFPSFYVTLPSNASQSFFPNNAINDFKVVMTPHLNLGNKQYTVALTNIAFENNFYILANPNSRRFLWASYFSQQLTKLYIPNRVYYTVDNIIAAINKTIISAEKKEAKRLATTPNAVTLKLEKKTNIVRMILKAQTNKKASTQKLQFQSNLAAILGFEENKTYIITTKDGAETTEHILATRSPILFVKPCFMRVICNIINHEYINGSRQQLLRQLTITEPIGTYVNISPNIHYYKSIILDNIPQIHIQLLDENNQLLPISGGQTVITLHFKQL